MSERERTSLEMHLMLLEANLRKSKYLRYIANLKLIDNERVLDFGCGPGVCSRYLQATNRCQDPVSEVLFHQFLQYINRLSLQ